MLKPTTDAREILRRIDRFCADADFTIEELREDLISDGIDPDEILRKIKARIESFIILKEK